MRVLIIGSGPNAVDARDWDGFGAVIAINNAWRIRPDWTHHIHPEDFPTDRRPPHVHAGQTIVTYRDYVPIQNGFGGFVYAGGTMAFTAGYWALGHFNPRLIAFIGCDMTYAATGATHFYGTGTADPLRNDVTLRDLTAKSARLMVMGAEQGCAMVNLSRAVLREAQALYPDLQVISLTAPPEVLAARLAGRGREAAEEQARRLSRGSLPLPEGLSHVHEVDNSGAIEETIAAVRAALQPESV